MKYLAALILFLVQASFAAEEKDLFYCQSTVAGFESFQISQLTETQGSEVKNSYQLKAGLLDPILWNQYGPAQMAPGVPLFQSQFSRVQEPPPPDPTQPPPEEAPAETGEEVYIEVSINESGSGSLSVNADLAPISCQRLF